MSSYLTLLKHLSNGTPTINFKLAQMIIQKSAVIKTLAWRLQVFHFAFYILTSTHLKDNTRKTRYVKQTRSHDLYYSRFISFTPEKNRRKSVRLSLFSFVNGVSLVIPDSEKEHTVSVC